MSCQNCTSDRMMTVGAKCNDCSFVSVPHLILDYDGYVLDGLNIGCGDYVEFNVCLDCGQLQGEWPITDSAVAEAFED